MHDPVSQALHFIKSHFLNSDPDLAISIHCPKCKRKVTCRVSRVDIEACNFLDGHLKHHCYVKTDFSGEDQVEIPTFFEVDTPSLVQPVDTPKPEDVPLNNPESNLSEGSSLIKEKNDLPISEDTTIPEVWEDPFSGGWIKLYRKIIDNPIFKDSEAYHLFSYLLLKANHKANKFLFNKNEILVERGQLITGTRKISEETGISHWKIRDRLKLLENLGIITRKITHRFSIITVCNYDSYQESKTREPHTKPHTEDEKEELKGSSQKSHTDHTLTTTNKKYKNNTYNGRSEKKETDLRVNEFKNYWGETFQEEIGNPYVFSFAKEGNLIKALLQVHSLDTLQEITKAFFRDDQCKRRGLTIGIFFQEINRLISQRVTDPIEQIKRQERLRSERQKQNESN